MVPFQKRVKHRQQKWYHFRKGSKILYKNGTISEKGQKSSTKMVPFQKRVKNGTISEEGQTSSTKMVPFQKRVKNRQQNGTILVRKWSSFLNKNGTIAEKGKKSSIKM